MVRKFCGHCGAQHIVLEGHQHCSSCGETDWSNPIPVAVCVQPVRYENGRMGLLIAKRAIEPKKGTWTMVGGHVEDGETIEEGAIRELYEETGFGHVTRANVLRPNITGSYANGKGHVLVAVEFPPIEYAAVLKMRPCEENEAIDVLWTRDCELGFPIHTRIAEQWFWNH